MSTDEARANREAARNPTAFELVWRNVWVRAAVQLVVLVLVIWLLIHFRKNYAFALQTALIGFVIAYILNPLVEGFGRIRVRRAPATVFIYILLIALFVFGTYLITQVVSELGNFINVVPRALDALVPLIANASSFFASWQERLPSFLTDRFGVGAGSDNVSQEVEARILALFQQATDELTNLLENILNRGPGFLLSGATGIFSTTLQVFLIFVASAYFLNDFPKFIANFRRFIPVRYRVVYEVVGQKADMAIGGYLRGQLVIALIELISYFVRPLSHSIRLGGNLMAGHAVIKVFAGFAGAMGVASVVPIAAITAIYGLELLVAAVQAYVFTILTCVYLRDAVGEAHH